MKKNIISLFTLSFFIPVLSFSEESRNNTQNPLYYNFIEQENNELMHFRPLSGWGEIRFPSSEQPEDRYNFILEGAFLKELDIAKYENKLSLTTFAHLNYVIDFEKYDYNNKLRPSAGIKVRYFPISNIALEVGTKYEWDRRITTDRTLEGVQIFLNGFASWDMNKIITDRHNYPGFTWFNIRHPGAPDNDEKYNTIIEGAIEQGIDWYRKNETTVNSFVEIKYIFDKEGYSWNNHITYSLGSKLKIPVTKKIVMQPGAKYAFNRRFKTDNWEQKTLVFLNWYF